MRDLETTTRSQRTRRPWNALLVGGISAALVVGALAPAMAAPGQRDDNARAGFHHHFNRGQQSHTYHRAANLGYSAANFGYGAAAFGLGAAGAAVGTAVDAAAMTADAEPWDSSMSYCMDRFKSYDPASGTYLGYDGREHACP